MKIKAKNTRYLIPMLSTGLFVIIVLIIITLLMHNTPARAQDYPVQGFDVSHHQGDIDWKKISPKHFQFVYIKATEGGDYQDPNFQQNWLNARERGFHVGAYHYFRLCREGTIQAQNFIATVPKKADALPPVIDLEYESQCIQKFTQQELLHQINVMYIKLWQHYGKPPIFYVSKTFYHIVLMGHFKHTPLWIRDYDDASPKLKDGRSWLFWQYSKQGKIDGIAQPVDLNVYAGPNTAWQSYLHYIGSEQREDEKNYSY
ncbi:MAG: GH25 family lysozyme [Acinetobacter sp.]